jgi:hypothetical protein
MHVERSEQRKAEKAKALGSLAAAAGPLARR